MVLGPEKNKLTLVKGSILDVLVFPAVVDQDAVVIVAELVVLVSIGYDKWHSHITSCVV